MKTENTSSNNKESCQENLSLNQLVPCTLYLGCVPPLLEVALRKFFPLLSVFCSSRPCCSLPLHDVIFPSHFGSAPRSSSFPHLPLCCAYCPPIVLHSCHMSSPSPFCIRYVFYDAEYIGFHTDFFIWNFVLIN